MWIGMEWSDGLRVDAPEGCGAQTALLHAGHVESGVGFQGCRDLHGDEKVAGEKIGEQESERRRVVHLVGSNHSVRLAPFPTAGRKILQFFAQLCGAHRISVDAHVLCEQTCERLQKPSFEISVNALQRLNHQGKTNGEAHRRLSVAADESLHVVELALAKKQHISACGEKSIDTTKQIGDLRRRIVRHERSSRKAKKASGRDLGFAQLLLKLLNSRGQQSHVNLGVRWI